MLHRHSFLYTVYLTEAATSEDWKLSNISASSEIGEYWIEKYVRSFFFPCCEGFSEVWLWLRGAVASKRELSDRPEKIQ